MNSLASGSFSKWIRVRRLIKDNYMRWSTAITMEIVGRGRIAYINERKAEPHETNRAWDTWFLEDNQVKTWIVNSAASDIQPLSFLRRLLVTWAIVEQMYGQKDVRGSALVSRGPMGSLRSFRKCAHCKKTGHTIEFSWDLHPEKKHNWKQNSSGKKPTNVEVFEMAGEQPKISTDQIRELRVYLSRIEIPNDESSDDVKVN
ncbi:hypothetical protein EJ110_NYTH58476 [Nymphaea thermarum]|nr:hypothetical protein EJ110_NYTH58476 [Nymphaea thermarum]